MIFVTDLDETVIYSNTIKSLYGIPSDMKVVAIETINGEDISYTSEDLLNWLKSNDRPIVIANTVRSIEEFSRLSISEYFDYAIVANGGVILHKGEVLDDWENDLRRHSFQDSLLEVQLEIAKLNNSSYPPNIIDNSYILWKVDDLALADKELASLIYQYPEYKVYRQKNKIYMLPKQVSKVNAMWWLADCLGENIDIAAGSSESDIEMIKYANIKIIPEHSIIKGSIRSPYIKVRSGVAGSKDIVNLVNGVYRGR